MIKTVLWTIVIIWAIRWLFREDDYPKPPRRDTKFDELS